jgi:hypothetical protein
LQAFERRWRTNWHYSDIEFRAMRRVAHFCTLFPYVNTAFTAMSGWMRQWTLTAR